MSPGQVGTYIGKIAAKLEAPKNSPEPKPRPRLINPVGGTTRVEVDRGKMSFREWKKARSNGTIS
jgi:hypothetical protein